MLVLIVGLGLCAFLYAWVKMGIADQIYIYIAALLISLFILTLMDVIIAGAAVSLIRKRGLKKQGCFGATIIFGFILQLQIVG